MTNTIPHLIAPRVSLSPCTTPPLRQTLQYKRGQERKHRPFHYSSFLYLGDSQISPLKGIQNTTKVQKINKNSPSLPTKFVIFSHSISSLQAIYDFNIDNDLVQKFIKEYSVQTKQGKTITLCWIPSHVGIPGNENANSAAKGGLSLSVTALKSPASELLPCITKLISEKWQKSWNNCTGALEALRDALYKYSTTTTTTTTTTGNKIQSVNLTVGVYQHVRSLSRRDAVIIH